MTIKLQGTSKNGGTDDPKDLGSLPGTGTAFVAVVTLPTLSIAMQLILTHLMLSYTYVILHVISPYALFAHIWLLKACCMLLHGAACYCLMHFLHLHAKLYPAEPTMSHHDETLLMS